MSYNLDFSFEPDYLHVQATGIRSMENIYALVKDCVKVSDEHAYERILIDVRGMTGKLEMVEAYYLGDKARAKLGRARPELKTAIVDFEKNRQRFHFLEEVLVKRGFNIRFFSKVDDAQQWLRESKDSSI